MNKFLRATVGCGISAVCLYLVFRHVSIDQLYAVAASLSARTVVLWMVLAGSSLLLRCVRWRILLQALKPVPLRLAFAVNSAGQLGNSILPARLGDLFRAANLGRAGLTGSFALATVLVERVLDTGFLVLVSAAAMGSFRDLPGWLTGASRLVAAVALGGLVFALLTPYLETQLLLCLRPITPRAWHVKLNHLVQQFVLGLRSLHRPRRVFGFLALTVVIWLLDGIGFTVVARGLSISLSPPVTILLLTSIALSSVLPAAPGNVGVYQMVVVAVLIPFGVARPQALGYGIILQFLVVANLAVWGLGGLFYLSSGFSRPVRKHVHEFSL